MLFPKDSWENGTKAQALIEFNYPDYSPYSTTFGNPLKDDRLANAVPDEIIAIARTTLENRPSSSSSDVPDSQGIELGPLLEDDSAGDPASLAIAVLLANASSNADPDETGEIKGVGWGAAAESQILHLLVDVPRSSVQAISYREKYSQAWGESRDSHYTFDSPRAS